MVWQRSWPGIGFEMENNPPDHEIFLSVLLKDEEYPIILFLNDRKYAESVLWFLLLEYIST